MSMNIDKMPEMGYRKFTGEPNRKADLAAIGLVRPGIHPDIRTATISVGGQERVIRVFPFPDANTGSTILRPIKADFRKAVREITGNYSL